jgi:MOSC domain-containing protein YiiM
MKLLAISVGQPKVVPWQGKEVRTGIFKAPVSHAVRVGKTSLEGDGQADLTVHGGFDKAVYAYSHDAYPWWKKQLGLSELPYGSFGENLTIDRLDEAQVFVGDRFEVGSCVLEAVQPRMPCFKLGIKFGDPRIIQTFYDFRRPGVYFRVLREGTIEAGDELRKVGSEKIPASITELFQFIKDKGVTTPERARELAQIASLNDKWKAKFERIANGGD